MSLKPIYYIYGSDDYLAEEALNSIKAEALKGGMESMNYQSFDARGMDASEVVSAAYTLPAFSDRRVVLIRGADGLKAVQEKGLMEYVSNPSPSTCLVFVSGASKVDKGSAFIKALNERGYLKACNRLNSVELSSWIKKEAKRQGKAITEGAARKLVSIVGDRLRDIKGELDKLALYTGEQDGISEADIDSAVLDLREETVFGLSDALGARDVKKALRIYSKVSDTDTLKILGAISRHIRILLKLKALLRKKAVPQAMASSIGVSQYFLENYIKSSRRFTEAELERAVFALHRADADLKTGRAPEAVVMPRLIIELCAMM
ncbi:MAG: DNA polymerase III subunit delta [Deltaproteobacteria bacterium]|nr:DNA polymerase III subunit delta [Deltaproteobacteria bacterium]